MALPVLAGAMIGAGLIGSLSGSKGRKKAYKAAMASMAQAGSLIEQQYSNVNDYFNQADTAFESQYKDYYGGQIQDAVNQIAGRGIYESPASELALGRTRKALAQSYATGKSELAGQKMQALGSIDQQRVAYLQNLASLQYNKAMARQQEQSQLFGVVGGIGSSILGL